MEPKTILDKLTIRDIERALTKFEVKDCWEWTAGKNELGYGTFYIWRKNRNESFRAHRVIFALFKGREPGPVLDHLCRNTSCCNPSHLEEVDHRTNILRGTGASARNAVKTHCIRGHEFDEYNTVLKRKPNGTEERECRTCRDEYMRAWLKEDKKKDPEKWRRSIRVAMRKYRAKKRMTSNI